MSNYAIHVLTISLWEWEGIKEHSNKSIHKNGANQFDCEIIEESEKKISDLKEAINLLKRVEPTKYFNP